MWNQNQVRNPREKRLQLLTAIKTVSPRQKQDLYPLSFGNFFGLKKQKNALISPPKNKTKKKDGITIIIENSSLQKLNFKTSKSWTGKIGIYQIPKSINPGELVAFDFHKASVQGNQGFVVYQIIDTNPHEKDYILIMGWSKPNNLETLNQAFVKIISLEDYENTNLEQIQNWLAKSGNQSQSIANGYSACAKAITKGSLPLWVNCLNSHL